MSDQAVQPGYGTDGRKKQTLESYQSVWMAHWTRARYSASEGICATNVSETEQLHFATRGDNLTDGLEISRNFKLFGFIVTRTFEIVDERVKASSKGIETEKMQSSLFEYDRLRHVMQSDCSLNASFPMTNTSGRGLFPLMSKCSGIELFPASEKTETKKSYNDCDSPQKLQNSAHDEGKTGIQTIVDSEGGTQGSSCKFPQITHILSKENDTFTSGRVFNGDTSRFPGQGKPLTSIDGEAKENHGKVNASKDKKLNSDACLTTSTKHSLKDVGAQWGKRTKLSSLNSIDQGTKGSDLDKNPIHEETKRSFDKMPKSSIASSKLELNYSQNDEDLKNQGKRLLLSNAWIKRWLHKKPKTLMVPEPEQLPSIAAMALMGKAMTGLKPCDRQNRGSFTIWNTKAF